MTATTLDLTHLARFPDVVSEARSSRAASLDLIGDSDGIVIGHGGAVFENQVRIDRKDSKDDVLAGVAGVVALLTIALLPVLGFAMFFDLVVPSGKVAVPLFAKIPFLAFTLAMPYFLGKVLLTLMIVPALSRLKTGHGPSLPSTAAGIAGSLLTAEDDVVRAVQHGRVRRIHYDALSDIFLVEGADGVNVNLVDRLGNSTACMVAVQADAAYAFRDKVLARLPAAA